MQKKSLQEILEDCLIQANPKITKPIHSNAHLVFDYGMDSLLFEKFFYLLEEELGITIPKDIQKSGYFSSLEGILILLREEYGWKD